jgi:hypothetical protein
MTIGGLILNVVVDVCIRAQVQAPIRVNAVSHVTPESPATRTEPENRGSVRIGNRPVGAQILRVH